MHVQMDGNIWLFLLQSFIFPSAHTIRPLLCSESQTQREERGENMGRVNSDTKAQQKIRTAAHRPARPLGVVERKDTGGSKLHGAV